jgi:RNA recognition motif-containing protein
MSTETSSNGRSRSRRPRRRRPEDGQRSDYRPTGGRRPSAPPKKKTLWEKIVGFFAGDAPKPAAGKSAQDSAPAFEKRERRPARESSSTSREREPGGIRRPEAVEVTSPRLYVGNLSFDAVESDLFDLFNGVGLVQNVEVVSNKHTMRSKGFAFVQMQTVEEAKRAVSELHDKEYMGRKLVVSGAKADDRRPERERSVEQQPEQ